VIEIACISRSRSEQRKEKPKQIYQKLLAVTGRVVAQARRFAGEIAAGAKYGSSMSAVSRKPTRISSCAPLFNRHCYDYCVFI
jgi:hypothetical protein